MAGDFKSVSVLDANNWFQSTPAHGGRHLAKLTKTDQQIVSIHARAWRATATEPWTISPQDCFNPRPRMAGDARRQARCEFRVCFNPRPRMAGDGNNLISAPS